MGRHNLLTSQYLTFYKLSIILTLDFTPFFLSVTLSLNIYKNIYLMQRFIRSKCITYLGSKSMKRILVILEDEEYNKLIEKKGNLSWHDFMLRLLELRH